MVAPFKEAKRFGAYCFKAATKTDERLRDQLVLKMMSVGVRLKIILDEILAGGKISPSPPVISRQWLPVN